ncbi:MAG: hypothetical protein ACE5FA_01325 [Dehalococcoidia bacterium]
MAEQGYSHDTEKNKATAVEVMSMTGMLSRAAIAVNVSRQTLYNWMKKDEQFKQDMEEARECGIEMLEDSCMARALEGVAEPVYQNGRCVGHKTKHSDQLAMFMLRANKPEKYRERYDVNLSGTVSLAEKLEAAHGRVRDRED